MMRSVAVAAALAGSGWAISAPTAVEEAALRGDDACLADPSGEGCAVALLQFRGARQLQEPEATGDAANAAEEPPAEGDANAAEEAPTEDAGAAEASQSGKGGKGGTTGGKGGKGGTDDQADSPGFCCYSGAGEDTCGTCYDTARAAAGEFCDSEATCGPDCQGTWCTMGCVFSADDPENICGTATSHAEPGSWCAESEDKCTSTHADGGCEATWCPMS